MYEYWLKMYCERYDMFPIAWHRYIHSCILTNIWEHIVLIYLQI